MQDYDVVILGSGAAGLFAAGEAARRGRRVLPFGHAKMTNMIRLYKVGS